MKLADSELAEIEGDLSRLYALDPELLADPYPLYRRLRQSAPVLRTGPIVSVSRYEDIRNVLRDPETFSSERNTGTVVQARMAELGPDQLVKYEYVLDHDSRAIATMDDPGHARLRRFVSETFSSKRIGGLREKIFEIAEELLDDIEARKLTRFDVIGEFTFHLPFRAICLILGVRREDTAKLRAWGDAVTRGISSTYRNLDEAYEALQNFGSYVQDLIDHSRANPGGEDLISELVNAQDEDGAYLTDAELKSIFVQMLVSGNTSTLLANALIALEQFPEQKQMMLDQPELIRPAVEEFLRYRSSIQAIHRVATRDTEIAGFPVRRNETIRLLLASANHDSEKFDDGDLMDITRKNARQHLSIGFGVHTCLGQWLLRMDAEAALTALFARYPGIRIDGPVKPRATFTQWGPEELFVAI